MHDTVAEAGGIIGYLADDGFGEGVAVGIRPVAALYLRRAILYEAAHEVLARRGHGRVEQGRDHHVEERVLRPAPGLPVVIGALHALDAVGEMHVAAHAGGVLAESREFRQAVERDVHLAGGAAHLEMLHAMDEVAGKRILVDELEEGALDVGIGDDEAGAQFVAVRQHDAGGPPAARQDLCDLRIRADRTAGGKERAGEGLRHRAHAAARIAPGADRAVHLAHIVVEEDIGRAGRHRAERGADDARERQIGLDDVRLEILVEEVGDRHGPETQRLGHFVRAELAEFPREIEQFGNVARAEAERVRRGAHQERLDEAALARHVAGIALVGLRVALRIAGEFAAMAVMVAVGGEIIAVAGEHRAALVGDDLQAVLRQFEIAHDLRAEEGADIGAVGIEEAGRQLAARRRAADPAVLFHDEDVEAGALEIAGRDQPVMAAADDQGIVLLHFDVSLVSKSCIKSKMLSRYSE